MNDTVNKENNILAQATAMQDAKEIKGTGVGYAISLIMDYGNGRQVTISGCLPLGATKDEFDIELDKLRLATNRQQAFVMKRDREARLAAEEKMVASLAFMIASYEKQANEEITRLESGDSAKMTVNKRQVENLRMQVANQKQMKQEELARHQSEIEICKTIIAGCDKEIEG